MRSLTGLFAATVLATGQIWAADAKAGLKIYEVECKDWENWYRDSVADQFYRDVDAATEGGTNPQGIKKIVWMFRNPAPVDVAEIRATMREALKKFISDWVSDPQQAKLLLDAFDAHLGLVVVPGAAPPPPRPTLPPPIIPKKKKDPNGP